VARTSARLVSCVMPTYRRPRFVEQAVKLFLRQTWGNSELIILDDSPAQEQTAERDTPRVKVVRLAERLPLGEKHNRGLHLAQGEYLAHWDDDDWQSPFRLIRQLETLVMEPVDVCGYTCDVLLTTGNARFWRFDRTFTPRKPKIGNSSIGVEYGIPFMDGSAMFRRSVVGATRYPLVAVGQKVVFLHELWKKRGARLKPLLNDGMYVYVRHAPKSGTANTWQYLKDRRLVEIGKPAWFPFHDLEFYRRAG
jgi:glycosyltransferase involved in cell wall biosynthesis